MADNVRIQIDLHTGTVQVEAPPDAVEGIFDRLEGFLPHLAEARHRGDVRSDGNSPNVTEREERSAEAAEGAEGAEDEEELSHNGGRSARKTTRRSKGGKPESFSVVDLKLTDAERGAFRAFYESKKPHGQSQQVLVVAYWLTHDGGRSEVTKNEIFTGLRTVGARIPTRLTSVVTNLVLEGRLVRSGKNVKVHHVGEDFVVHELPAASRAAAAS